MEDRTLQKIQKLLTRAKDQAGSTEGEREQALRMAHALAARHNLDIAMIEAEGGQSEQRLEEKNRFYGRPWARSCCVAIADLFFCKYLYISISGTKDAIHCFIGRKSNAVTAAELSKYVVESILKEGKRKARENYEGNPWFRSFSIGAAREVSHRCHEMRRAAEKQTARQTVDASITTLDPSLLDKTDVSDLSQPLHSMTGTALVLKSFYETEYQANQKMIEDLYPKLRSGRSGAGISNFDAMNQGRSYGKTVSLNRQVGDNRNERTAQMKPGDVVVLTGLNGTLNGLRARIIRQSKRTGGLTVELMEVYPTMAYRVGDKINVNPYEVKPS